MNLLKTNQFNYTHKDALGGVEPEIRLYVPHGASVEDFSQIFPNIYDQIVDVSPSSEDELRAFWTLEADLYSYEFALIVAQKIDEILRPTVKAKIEVVASNLLRGVIDINRKIEHALWNIFDFDKNPNLVGVLSALHQETIRRVKNIISETSIGREIHTMSPILPSHDVIVDPTNIEERLEAWSGTNGSLLYNDIVCKLEGTDEINVGDEIAIHNMKENFEACGFQIGYSERYHAGPEYYSPIWARTAIDSYVISDFTKDNGSKEKPGDDDFCLWQLTYEKSGLDKLAVPFAISIVQDYLRIRSKKSKAYSKV